MDNIVSLYTTTNGRLSRKQWWLGVLGLLVASIVLSFILSLVGLSAWGSMGMAFDPANPDPAVMAAAAGDMIRKGAWASLIMFLILAFPSYCLSVKRRHDRDDSGRDILIYMGVNLVLLLAQALGLGLGTMDLGNGIMMPAPAMWFSAVSLIVGLFGLYLIVMLGFLRGTIGSNAYGPDPVLGTMAAA